MEVLEGLIWDGFVNVVTNIYNDLVNILSGGMLYSMAAALQILDVSYVKNMILNAQIIGGSLLTLKILYDTLYNYILHVNGEPTDSGGILVRIALAAGAVIGAPEIAKQVYSACTDLASEVAGSQAIESSQLSPFFSISDISFIVTILAIVGLALWILILIQTGIRAVELVVLSVVGSGMAVGLTNPDQGTFAVWWRELIVLSMSQVIQIFLVKGALSTLMLISATAMMQMLFFIGWLWVAYRTPAVLRQYAYSTGVGSAVGGAVQQGGSFVMLRMMLRRGA